MCASGWSCAVLCVSVSRRSWQKLPNMLLSCFLRVCKVGPGGKRFKDPPHLLMRSNLGVFGWKIHHFHFRMKKNPPCASWTEKWFLRLAKRSKQVKIVDCHSNDSIKMIFIMIFVMIFHDHHHQHREIKSSYRSVQEEVCPPMELCPVTFVGFLFFAQNGPMTSSQLATTITIINPSKWPQCAASLKFKDKGTQKMATWQLWPLI